MTGNRAKQVWAAGHSTSGQVGDVADSLRLGLTGTTAASKLAITARSKIDNDLRSPLEMNGPEKIHSNMSFRLLIIFLETEHQL